MSDQNLFGNSGETNESTNETTNTSETNSQLKPSKKTRRIPLNAANLLALSLLIQESWTSRPDITLSWKTQEEFAANVADLQTKVNEKSTKKGRRSPISKQLHELDVLIDSSLCYVKNSLQNLYSQKNAVSYYAGFGIEHSKSGYKIPRDRQARLQALDMMVAAISEHNIVDNIHGLDFWTNIKDSYNNLMSQTTDNIKGVSVLKGANDQLIIEIRKVLTSLIYIIRGNHPDTVDNELRNWGFLREIF